MSVRPSRKVSNWSRRWSAVSFLSLQDIQPLVDVVVDEGFGQIGGRGRRRQQDGRDSKAASQQGAARRRASEGASDQFLFGQMFAVCYGKFKAGGNV